MHNDGRGLLFGEAVENNRWNAPDTGLRYELPILN